METLDWNQIIIALIMSIPGIYAATKQIMKEKSESDKIKADAASIITDTARDLIEEMRIEMKNSKTKIELLEKTSDVYEKVIRILIRQLRAHDVDPVITEEDLEKLLEDAQKKEERLEKN